jgi:ubiquinol-cytochrome c reductase cytochrome b subunit
MVTTLVMMNNQQVTNSQLDLVGTSETLRIVSFLTTIITFPNSNSNSNSNSNDDKRYNEWLAGIIDGNGTLLVSKSGSCSCEITMDKYDEHTLMHIKNKLGGSVKSRSGSNSYRYRCHNTKGMIDLIHRINGNIRNSKRVPQLMRICEKLNIPYIPAIPLTLDNSWFSGFFDTDGTI